MDVILLTHDQQGDAIDIALARCTRDRELSPVHTVAEEVARAQLRKVVEWIEQHGTEFSGVDDPSWKHKALIWSAWQALRVAAEEVRG